MAKELAKYKIALKKLNSGEAGASFDYTKEIASMQEKVKETYMSKNLNTLSYHTQNLKDTQVFPVSRKALTITKQLGLDNSLFFGDTTIEPQKRLSETSSSRREFENAIL